MPSELKCEVCTIDKLEIHPGADRLEVAQILGWQVVVRKDCYRVGQKVVYLQIDSVLPQSLETILFPEGSKITLDKGRVKTIKIRGVVSQGMVVDLDTLGILSSTKVGTDVAEVLGITKYCQPTKVPNLFKGNPEGKSKHSKFFKPYSSINHLKNFLSPLDGLEVEVSEKIHGCFAGNTKITLSDGSTKTIKEIVESRLDVEVVSVDTIGNLVNSKVTNWFNNGITNGWWTIKVRNLSRGDKYRVVRCTPSHKFLTRDGYVEAHKLGPQDIIYHVTKEVKPSKEQESVLIGKMLGDGSLCGSSVAFGHKKEHEEYTNFTLQSLGNIAGNKQKEQMSGYGTLMTRGRSQSLPRIKKLFESWNISGKKEVPADLKLDPISLAFWYMDDGSLSHSEKQRDRASFATCGFSGESVIYLLNALRDLGIEAVVQDGEAGPRVRLNKNSADLMFRMIQPYVPKVMQYKLPVEYRGIEVSFQVEDSTTELVKNEQCVLESLSLHLDSTSKRSRTKYDIETGEHSYVANGIIVHNSNIRAGWVPVEPKTLWEKLKHWFTGATHQFAYGSHNVQLKPADDKNCYYPTNVYWKTARQYNLEETLRNYCESEGLNSIVIYGEVYGDGIQKNYKYGCNPGETKAVFFDVLINGECLNPDDLRTFLSDVNLPSPECLYRGKYTPKLEESFDYSVSRDCPDQKVMEGCVLKSAEGPRKIFKYINPEYLLLKGNTEWT